VQIELDHHPEPEPSPSPTANPYQTPAAPLIQPSESTNAALWNPNAAANWCLVFSPVFGSYLHYRNWLALGEEDRARTAKTWFVLSCVLQGLLPFLGLMTMDPQGGVMIARGIAFWYLIIWYFAVGRGQAKFVKEHLGDAYEKRGWSMPLLIGLGALVGYLVLFGLIGAAVAVARH
jgi:hypothetical protein